MSQDDKKKERKELTLRLKLYGDKYDMTPLVLDLFVEQCIAAHSFLSLDDFAKKLSDEELIKSLPTNVAKEFVNWAMKIVFAGD